MAPKIKLTEPKMKMCALLSSQGRPRKVIQQMLGLSHASVGRAFEWAREVGILIDRPRCTLEPQEIEELEHLIYSPGLLDALRGLQPGDARHLRKLRIFPAGRMPNDPGPEYYRNYRDAFGRLVAVHLLEDVLPNIASIGVTWGGTLLSVVRGIAHHGDLRTPPRQPVEFLPVCGAPPDAIEAALRSSSNLVASLDELLGDTSKNPNNFTGVPAAIPSHFNTADTRVLQKYFRGDRGYGRVFGFGETEGRIHSMDAVMTSVGTANPDENPWIAGAAVAAGIDAEDLAGIVLGNVGGLFLPRPGLDARELGLIERVNERWTGIGFDHFLACNARAHTRGHGGTLLVAFGRRADVVLQCICDGLVAELLIDAELATQLGAAVGWQPPQD